MQLPPSIYELPDGSQPAPCFELSPEPPYEQVAEPIDGCMRSPLTRTTAAPPTEMTPATPAEPESMHMVAPIGRSRCRNESNVAVHVDTHLREPTDLREPTTMCFSLPPSQQCGIDFRYLVLQLYFAHRVLNSMVH